MKLHFKYMDSSRTLCGVRSDNIVLFEEHPYGRRLNTPKALEEVNCDNCKKTCDNPRFISKVLIAYNYWEKMRNE